PTSALSTLSLHDALPISPRWLATAVLLILVWTVLLSFVGLLVLSVAQMAALLPHYSGQAEVLINQVVGRLNNAGIVSGQLSDLVDRKSTRLNSSHDQISY